MALKKFFECSGTQPIIVSFNTKKMATRINHNLARVPVSVDLELERGGTKRFSVAELMLRTYFPHINKDNDHVLFNLAKQHETPTIMHYSWVKIDDQRGETVVHPLYGSYVSEWKLVKWLRRHFGYSFDVRDYYVNDSCEVYDAAAQRLVFPNADGTVTLVDTRGRQHRANPMELAMHMFFPHVPRPAGGYVGRIE